MLKIKCVLAQSRFCLCFHFFLPWSKLIHNHLCSSSPLFRNKFESRINPSLFLFLSHFNIPYADRENGRSWFTCTADMAIEEKLMWFRRSRFEDGLKMKSLMQSDFNWNTLDFDYANCRLLRANRFLEI